MTRLISLLASFLSASVFAQAIAVPTFELERLQLNPGARHGLLVGGADLMPEGGFRVSLTAHYEHDPLVYRATDGTRLATVVGSRFTAHLAGAWAPTKWLEVGLQLPIVLYQGNSSQLTDVGVTAPQSTALGTPYLQVRLGLLRQAEQWPVDLSLGAALGVPLGSDAALTRDPSVSVTPTVGVGRTFGTSVRVGLDVGATLRGTQALSPENPDAHDVIGSQFNLGVGAATLGAGLRGEVSLRSIIPFTRAPGAAELMLGVRYPLGDFELFALGGPGFGRLVGTPVFRVLLGVAYVGGRKAPVTQSQEVPPPRCVEGTAYVLADCPDSDLDRDGLKNGVDVCPTVGGSAEAKGCPDADRDGIVDSADKCPAEKGPASLGGCPDSDADLIADNVDECPREAGPADRKGCPAKDRDADGVLDEVDACPDAAGPAERKGCPLIDTDADGVADEADNCPKVPGVPENQGCPKDKRQLVVITRDKIFIKEKVYFDTGKSRIQPRSFSLLDQVAQILVEHPDVKRVVVEGHTDSRGKVETNRKLSQDRADAVKVYLVKKGVEVQRLESKGYGPDRSVADNGTAEGREQNRRVEFVISTAEKVESKTIEVP